MQRLAFSVTIHAAKEHIWRTMLADETYRRWTSAFDETSYAVTDWQPGSKALFLTASGTAMVGRIAAHRPNEFLSIEHLGYVKDGVEDLESAKEKGWSGAQENYTLTGKDGAATLIVEMDVNDEFRNLL